MLASLPSALTCRLSVGAVTSRAAKVLLPVALGTGMHRIAWRWREGLDRLLTRATRNWQVVGRALTAHLAGGGVLMSMR